MAKSTYPRDRFDDLPADAGRIGAHRAENPRMNGWVVMIWAVVATVVLVAAGILGTLLATGRIDLFPAPEATVASTPAPEITPVLDPTYTVLVLNATSQDGLATEVKTEIEAAGWAAEDVLASEASQDDFETTTVYYAFEEDAAAAAGLADVLGGALVAQSDQYLQTAAGEGDEQPKQLTVVLGMDRVEEP
ncbi:LytR C-terminal domain-containing protein [Microbacterium terricola]|uniref:LytR/CpsA/Psr regulator C-terminal domain-containing protein n=1 Tax=Microbacterium terricola TaxID=344163 RepID=A0ABM8E049_9MICO|nr:LytR C-terminal domain-containing protein [Microbacterium terricola]UYK40940.1 LytR C-terminal domain-containing protein [Microbacterium terricola]BDV31308.1 hypothetical protein Microterr_19680 [Microbacterium terricola]